jgi:hypothetical protein
MVRLSEPSQELLRLRGEVGMLRQMLAESVETPMESNGDILAGPTDTVTANPVREEGKVPILGDLPVLGHLFRTYPATSGGDGL